jgi:hypothetical protein
LAPRAGLAHMEKWKLLILPGLELRFLGFPARSQWLYRLSYRGSLTLNIRISISLAVLGENMELVYIVSTYQLEHCWGFLWSVFRLRTDGHAFTCGVYIVPLTYIMRIVNWPIYPWPWAGRPKALWMFMWAHAQSENAHFLPCLCTRTGKQCFNASPETVHRLNEKLDAFLYEQNACPGRLTVTCAQQRQRFPLSCVFFAKLYSQETLQWALNHQQTESNFTANIASRHIK